MTSPKWFNCLTVNLISPLLGSVENNKSIYYLNLVSLSVILSIFLCINLLNDGLFQRRLLSKHEN